MFDGERLAAHDPRHGQPFHCPDGDKQHHEVAVKDHHQDNDEEYERQRIEYIDEAHHDLVERAAHIARDCAIEHADRKADQGRHQTDRERNPCAIKHANEQIASDGIGAEPVRAAGVADDGLVRPPIRRARHHVPILGFKTVLRQQRREDRHQRDDPQNNHAGDGGFVGEQTSACIDPQAAACQFLCTEHRLRVLQASPQRYHRL